MDFGFSFGNFGSPGADEREDPVDEPKKATTARNHRRTTACTEYVKPEKGVSYNFITAGDVDSLSYLKVVLNWYNLDYVLCSTWCMAAEDILQLQEWHEAGRIKRLDMYLGEIFPGSYKIEWEMVKAFYKQHPDAGRAAIFRNHSKIYAGANYAEDFYFGIQTSANINTNPRTENGNITIDQGLFEFYKDYFDGIISFEKDA